MTSLPLALPLTAGDPVSAPTGASGRRPPTMPDDREPPKVYLDLPEVSTHPVPPPAPPSRWWRYGFPAVLVLLFAAVPVLVYAGAQVVLNSNDGRLIPATADPSSPGWEATVPPTPDHGPGHGQRHRRAVERGAAGAHVGQQGGVVLIPADTQVTVGRPPRRWSTPTSPGGSARLKTAVEAIIGTGIDDITVANSGNWQDLVAPAGVAHLRQPRQRDRRRRQALPAGPDHRPAVQGGRVPRVTELGRGRHQPPAAPGDLWKAWLGKIGAAPRLDRRPG